MYGSAGVNSNQMELRCLFVVLYQNIYPLLRSVLSTDIVVAVQNLNAQVGFSEQGGEKGLLEIHSVRLYRTSNDHHLMWVRPVSEK